MRYVRYDKHIFWGRQPVPFRDQEDTNRFYDGLYKAGLPETYTFYRLYEENKLTQEDIKNFFFGRKFIENHPDFNKSNESKESYASLTIGYLKRKSTG